MHPQTVIHRFIQCLKLQFSASNGHPFGWFARNQHGFCLNWNCFSVNFSTFRCFNSLSLSQYLVGRRISTAPPLTWKICELFFNSVWRPPHSDLRAVNFSRGINRIKSANAILPPTFQSGAQKSGKYRFFDSSCSKTMTTISRSIDLSICVQFWTFSTLDLGRKSALHFSFDDFVLLSASMNFWIWIIRLANSVQS